MCTVLTLALLQSLSLEPRGRLLDAAPRVRPLAQAECANVGLYWETTAADIAATTHLGTRTRLPCHSPAVPAHSTAGSHCGRW